MLWITFKLLKPPPDFLPFFGGRTSAVDSVAEAELASSSLSVIGSSPFGKEGGSSARTSGWKISITRASYNKLL